jgi:hypothetical protein
MAYTCGSKRRVWTLSTLFFLPYLERYRLKHSVLPSLERLPFIHRATMGASAVIAGQCQNQKREQE